MASATAPPARWYFGPVPDLLLRVAPARDLLMAQKGDLEGAIARAQSGLALHENDVGQQRIGFLYESAQRRESAVGAYRRALELRPDWPQVQNNLAWILATNPNANAEAAAEAVHLAEAASEALGGSDANALDTLAVAYASAGRFRDARRAATRALAAARERGDSNSARSIAERRELFRREQRYHGAQ
jgi:Flp pilus assembly protein TadD